MRSYVLVFALMGIVCFPCSGIYAQNTWILQIVHVKTARVLHVWQISPGERFYLDYIHSSASTPVRDIFTINTQGKLVLLEENFSWFGAGLEAGATDEVQVIYDTEQKKIRVLQHRTFPLFLLRIGRIANHRITFRQKCILLQDLTSGGELIRIAVVPVNL